MPIDEIGPTTDRSLSSIPTRPTPSTALCGRTLCQSHSTLASMAEAAAGSTTPWRTTSTCIRTSSSAPSRPPTTSSCTAATSSYAVHCHHTSRADGSYATRGSNDSRPTRGCNPTSRSVARLCSMRERIRELDILGGMGLPSACLRNTENISESHENSYR